MDGAVAYYNCNTDITKQLNVSYDPTVPTADGNFNAASHALYAALLERIARSGAVALHASKTGGDYWRELRRRL